MNINILTIFPDYFNSILKTSMIARALGQGQIKIEVIDIRTFATDVHHVTDDRPFGGGPGMVMKIEPIDLALKSVLKSDIEEKTVLTSANGKLFNQTIARDYSQLKQLNIVCGHYEGVDQRVIDHLIDDQVRIGDYVLTGGEPAAAVIVDAVTRLIPGVLGNKDSNQDESHAKKGQGGYPQYTRPANYKGWQVPELLLSGNHAEIAEWRNNNRKLL